MSSLLPYSRDETSSRLPPTREASEDVYPAYTHPKMVTPASASGLEHPDFLNTRPEGAGTAVGAVDPAQGSGHVTGGSVAGEGAEGEGTLAGSLQGSRKSSVSGSTKQYLADLQAQCSVL